MGLKTSQAGISMIKQFEGCVLKVYLDVVGVKTVGYGHTGIDVDVLNVGTKITQQQADALLIADLVKFESKVNKYYSKYIWTQNEFDALVSFAYNVGSIDQLTANGTRSKQTIADVMLAYDHAGKKVISGLTKRRKAEREMFLLSQPSYNSDYVIGSTYTTDANLYIRLVPNGDKLEMKSLTTNAQINAYTDDEGYSILKKGTRVTCKDLKVIGNETWLKIPSGWICGKKEGKTYIV